MLSGPAALLLFNVAIMLINSASVTGLQNMLFGTVTLQYWCRLGNMNYLNFSHRISYTYSSNV